MATLKPTLSLSSTDAHSNPLSMSVTTSLTVQAPSMGITRMSCDENFLGQGASIIIPESDTTNKTQYLYVKHLGKLASDGTTSSHASNDFVTIQNADGEYNIATLQPNDFAFIPLSPFDGNDSGVEEGGIKVTKGGAAVMIEFGFWTRT